MAHLRSVNTGTPRAADWAGRVGATAIERTPVVGPVHAGRLGLAGDEVADTTHHGGVDQAVYAFAREDLDHWETELGGPLADGAFGENLTTVGIDVNAAEIGERWRIGEALLEVCSVRIPCRTFQAWLGRIGHDETAWVRRFTGHARPGPYLRVLTEGALAVGDDIEVVHRPGHGVSVAEMFRALTTERSLLPRLADLDAVTQEARDRARAYVAGSSYDS